MPIEGMPARAAYQIIHDELNLDGNPALNLASFVTTWMEPEADKLIMESIGKNYVDNDEYPQTEVIQDRVVNMLARLFNAPDDCHSIGSGTIGFFRINYVRSSSPQMDMEKEKGSRW